MFVVYFVPFKTSVKLQRLKKLALWGRPFSTYALKGGEGVHQKRTIAYVGGRGGLGKMYVLCKKKRKYHLKNIFFRFWSIFAPVDLNLLRYLV